MSGTLSVIKIRPAEQRRMTNDPAEHKTAANPGPESRLKKQVALPCGDGDDIETN